MATTPKKRPSVSRKATPSVASRTCVLVLGMHRSGTSALTRVLNLLGYDLPANMLGANPTNEAGHWESEPLIQMHDRLLRSAGSSWDDWMEFNPEWFSSPRADEFREEALQILDEQYGKSRLFVLKDPRICRLAPFWLDVLEHAGVQPVAVIPVRNPMDVAASLQKRNDFDPALTHLLWLRHILDAEHATRGIPRCFTGYDDLLANWARVVEQVRVRTAAPLPRYSEQAATEIEAFLTDRLRHHKQDPEVVIENPSLSRWLRDSYGVLLSWVRTGERAADYPMLDRIRQELNAASPAFGRLIAKGKSDRKTVVQLTKAVEEQKTKLEAALDKMREEAKQLADRLSQTESALAQRSLEAEQTAAEVSELREELQARERELAEAKQLADRLSQTESALAQRSLEAEQTAAEVSALREERKARDREIAEAKQLADRLSQTESALAQRSLEVKQTAAEVSTIREELQARERELGEAKQLAETKQRVVEGLHEHVRMLEVERLQEDAAVTSLKAEMEATTRKFNDAVAEVNSELARKERQLIELTRLQTEREAAAVELAEKLNKANADKVAETKRLKEEVAKAQAERALKDRQLKERFDEIAKMTRLLAERSNGGQTPSSPVGPKNPAVNGSAILGVPDSRLSRHLPERLRIRLQMRRLRQSGIFDAEWYLRCYEDVAKAGVDPLRHYVMYGTKEGRAPNGRGAGRGRSGV